MHTALKLVGLADRMKHKPRELSGGQEQRVGIARAIVTDPTLLLCDEPTGDLDRKSGDEILDLLQALNKQHGKTIVMVTHDPHAAERANRTLHLEKGRLEREVVRCSAGYHSSWANLQRRKLRLVFTFASILVAFLMFGMLDALRTSMVEGVNMAGADRLIMRNKAGLTAPLPGRTTRRSRRVEGVRAVSSQSWFGAEFRTPQNPKFAFPLFATQPGPLLEVQSDLKLKLG